MFSVLLKTCTDCDNLEDAICAIDAVLAQFGKNLWQNTAFMTNKPLPYVKIRQLMYYKEILIHLRWNQDLYCPYKYPDIVSRVKALTAGQFTTKKREMPIYARAVCECGPDSTTTTTSSTTTTSTTLGPAEIGVTIEDFGESPLTITNITIDDIPVQGAFPIEIGSHAVHSQLYPDGAEITISITGEGASPTQCIGYILNPGGDTDCLSYIGPGNYTFSDVTIPASGLTLYIHGEAICPEGPFVSCSVFTTTTTTSSTTTTTTTLGPSNIIIDNSNSSLTITGITVGGIPVQANFPIEPFTSDSGITQVHPEGTDVTINIEGTANSQCIIVSTTLQGNMCQTYTEAGSYLFEDVVIQGEFDIGVQIHESGTCATFCS